MKIHIIGICGTFMGGVARLARELNYEVTGSDANTYPPMSTQLEALNITLFEGYSADNIPGDADVIVIGNSISRGNPELEHVLEKNLNYTSGAQWLSEHVLQDRWVLAVAGTHGKTTTSSLLTWILQDNDLEPGFLIGGVPENFGISSRLGNTPFFVIEADEYDTAFFDKRSKFVHYKPRTLILNNLEFDHADIFDDLTAIQKQFHHLIRTIPMSGRIITNQQSEALSEVLNMGCWSEIETFGRKQSDWQTVKDKSDASKFELKHQDTNIKCYWDLIGEHNMQNALAAIAAAHHVGIPIENACRSLASFKSVKRRMEHIGEINGLHVYDDFAHHPTAIEKTLSGLRNNVGKEPILAILEPRSNTMKQGVHKHLLKDSLANADFSCIYFADDIQWEADFLLDETTTVFDNTEKLLQYVINNKQDYKHVLIMSNGGFENLHQRLLSGLEDCNN